MNVENKVLACVDQSRFAEFVADYAAWAASRMKAPLEFLHILDRQPEVARGADHSGAIGVDAQANLLTRLSLQDEQRSRAAREQGRRFLNTFRERALSSGVSSADVRQRHGELEATLVEQEPGVRLFVLGRRGESAGSTQRDLGRNVERVVRALRNPVLTVTEGFREPRRVMIAFDGGIVTRRGVEMVAGSPLFRGLPVHLLMSGRARRCAEADRMGPDDAGDRRPRDTDVPRSRGCGNRDRRERLAVGHRPPDHGGLCAFAAAQPAVRQQDFGPPAPGHDSDTPPALKRSSARAMQQGPLDRVAPVVSCRGGPDGRLLGSPAGASLGAALGGQWMAWIAYVRRMPALRRRSPNPRRPKPISAYSLGSGTAGIPLNCISPTP